MLTEAMKKGKANHAQNVCLLLLKCTMSPTVWKGLNIINLSLHAQLDSSRNGTMLGVQRFLCCWQFRHLALVEAVSVLVNESPPILGGYGLHLCHRGLSL